MSPFEKKNGGPFYSPASLVSVMSFLFFSNPSWGSAGAHGSWQVWVLVSCRLSKCCGVYYTGAWIYFSEVHVGWVLQRTKLTREFEETQAGLREANRKSEGTCPAVHLSPAGGVAGDLSWGGSSCLSGQRWNLDDVEPWWLARGLDEGGSMCLVFFFFLPAIKNWFCLLIVWYL